MPTITKNQPTLEEISARRASLEQEIRAAHAQLPKLQRQLASAKLPGARGASPDLAAFRAHISLLEDERSGLEQLAAKAEFLALTQANEVDKRDIPELQKQMSLCSNRLDYKGPTEYELQCEIDQKRKAAQVRHERQSALLNSHFADAIAELEAESAGA